MVIYGKPYMLKMTSILLKQGYTVATAMLNLLSRGARKTGSTVHHLLKWAALCQLCRLIIKSKYWMIHSVITCHSLTLSDYEHWQRESAGGGKRSHDTRAVLNHTVQNSSAVGWWLTGIPDIIFFVIPVRQTQMCCVNGRSLLYKWVQPTVCLLL